MYCLAVVPQSLLREPFRHSCGLGAFRPCVAVGMQGNAFNAKLTAALPKLRRTVASPHAGQIRKQHAFGGQVFEHVQSLRAQVD